MNICIYTSTQPSVSNLLNISHLIAQRPQHTYSILSVVKPHKPLSLMEKVKKVYGETRFDDGRYDFHRDSMLIEKKLAAYLNPLNTQQYANAQVPKVNDEGSEAFVTKIKPDIILQAGAGILAENIFSKATIATINVHHGIAPEIRGIDSTFWCMFYGIKEKIGVTCHIIDKHLDTGAVILRQTLETKATTYADIQAENYLMGRNVLVNSIDLLEKGYFKTASNGMVKSYYFGMVNPFLYYALKKRNYHPIMKIADKAYKMKEEQFVEL